MFPLPIPTDNLYKFLALTGVGLVVLSLVFPLSKIQELELAELQNRIERNVLEIEVAEMDIHLNSLLHEVTRLEEQADGGKLSENEVAARIERQRAKSESLAKRNTEIKIKREQLRGSSERSMLLLQQTKRAWVYLKVLGLLGLVLGQSGFYLWYRRVQIPADKAAAKSYANDA